MKKATLHKHTLIFREPGGTSRGILTSKPCPIIELNESGKKGFGEVSLLPGLSNDDNPEIDSKISQILSDWESEKDLPDLSRWPSLRFGMETALLSLKSNDPHLLFPSEFTEGNRSIEINGLVWMGEKEVMRKRIREKVAQGFTCVKLKIGAINLEDEFDLIQFIRNDFESKELELRVDANGAFTPNEAPDVLKRLKELEVNSIEQPIKAGQWQEMARLCENTPVDIALDEELIGVENRVELIETIKPQAVVLKPGLLGGLKPTQEWIEIAERNNSYWWITSALESSIGLNAIAQFTAIKNPRIPQGLGTGQLYTNNFDSPLTVEGKFLYYRSEKPWMLNFSL